MTDHSENLKAALKANKTISKLHAKEQAAVEKAKSKFAQLRLEVVEALTDEAKTLMAPGAK